MASLVQGLQESPDYVQRSKPKTPKGYDTSADFLQEMRERYDAAKGHNEHNQVAGQDDAKFTVGKQWETLVEQRRKTLRKPVLTFNRLVAFVAQIVGNRLMNETEIRVWPDKAGTKAVAELRESIIRQIYKASRADYARDEAMKYQVVGGQGAFQLSMEWSGDDVFTKDIKIMGIADPYSATWDPLATDPSGGDAEYAWVEDDIPAQTFKHRYPWAAETSFNDGKWNRSGYWLGEDTIRVVSYWRMVVEGYKTLALYKDSTVHDITDMEEYEYTAFVETKSDGSPYTRRVPKRFARQYVCSGNDILEGPFDYPISSIPIYRVPGWELHDGEQLHRWGLVRFLKDPQRLHNYWRSMQAEQLVAAPRNKWLTTQEAVKGHEARWRKSPQSDDPFLFYNDGEMAPVHIPPPGVDAGLMNEAMTSMQDLKDISNIHEANLGMPSNEVSGVAIQQRQQVSDVGSFIYHDRLRIADERCAKNIDELIPFVYDTTRMIAVVGRDNKTAMQIINDPSKPDSDVTVGKYGITVSVGPATVTKRQLAAEQMMSFINAVPGSAATVMDLVAEAQDWPKADEFARRFRLALPPGVLDPSDMSPQEQQMAQQQQQMQQMQQQLEQAMANAKLSDMQAQSALREAQAHSQAASSFKAVLDAHSRAADVAGKNLERDRGHAMEILDQHNALQDSHRNFAKDVTDMQQQHGQNMSELALAANQQAHDQRIAMTNQKFQQEQAEQQAAQPTENAE